MDTARQLSSERRRSALVGCAATASVTGGLYGSVYALVGAGVCGVGALVCLLGAGAVGLVAEDNATNQRIAKRMLSRPSIHVTVVDNGAEALEAVRRTKFDLVLMDVQMPEMDGLQATARIRELESAEARSATPIVALSANATASDQARCRSAGMDDFLAKPYRRQELFRMVRLWSPSESVRES